MLHDFVSFNRDELVSRARAKVSARPWPTASHDEMQNVVPLFLTQLAETLRLEKTASPFSPTAIGASAAKHGRDLLAMGFTISQVVHDYGDVCQAITELAVEKGATISAEEFHTLNRCLDTAIAEAVTEYARLKEEETSRQDLEHRGRIAHDLRNLLQTALLSFQVLKSGKVGASGSTGDLLGRTLVSVRDLVENIVSEVRLAANGRRRERLSVLALVDEVAVAANLHAQYRHIRFTVEPVDPTLAIDAEPQLLAPALMNLLHNAFSYTPANGHVTVRARAENGRVSIDVEDECGGLGQDGADTSGTYGDRRGSGRSGLGLGLSLSRKAVTASGGKIRARNLPGKGCIFTIEVPLASPEAAEPVSIAPRHSACGGLGGSAP